MGLSNRDYFQDDSYGSYGSGGTGGPVGPMTATKIVTIAIAVGYVLTTLMGPSGDLFRLSEGAVKSGAIWQLITYGFSASTNEGDVIFIFIFIALFFYSLSSHMVEPVIGKAEYLWLYLATIFLGGVVGVLVPSNNLVNHAGTLVAPHAIIIWAAMKYPRHMIHLFGIIPIQLWIIGAIDALYAIWPTIAASGRGLFLVDPVVIALAVSASHQYHGWRFTSFSSSLKNMKPKTKLKVYAPENTAEKDDELATKVDAILEKISREGESSLSSKERRLLKQASKKYKDRV